MDMYYPAPSGHLSIGMTAPDFSANTTFGPIRFSDYKGKWVVFFSHPGDFTPVCTTEFLAFAQAYPQFLEKNVQLLGLSIDSNPSHLAWANAIFENTGITIPFPIVADRTGDVARLYNMIAPDTSTQETVRNVFIIDPEQTIRAILIYPLTNGRSIPEIMRLVEALQKTDKDKVVTTANWQPGQATMVPAPKTYSDFVERQTSHEKLGLSCKDWYWCYKQLPSASQPVNSQANRP